MTASLSWWGRAAWAKGFPRRREVLPGTSASDGHDTKLTLTSYRSPATDSRRVGIDTVGSPAAASRLQSEHSPAVAGRWDALAAHPVQAVRRARWSSGFAVIERTAC
jgi:hypothetical protein